MFLLLVFLHIAFMFTAVALTYGPEILLLIGVRANRAESVRAVTTSTRPIAMVVPILYGLGGIFGLAAGLVAGYNLLAPWLLIAYAVFIALTVIGVAITGPNMERLATALAGAADGPLTGDAAAVVASPAFRIAAFLDFALLLLVLFAMVFKPFS